jgi:hypothetical protein
MLYCLRSSFGPQKKNLNQVHALKNIYKHKLKMPSFLWQGNLPNRASKIKCLLARHDIHLPQASGQVLSYTSALGRTVYNSQSSLKHMFHRFA